MPGCVQSGSLFFQRDFTDSSPVEFATFLSLTSMMNDLRRQLLVDCLLLAGHSSHWGFQMVALQTDILYCIALRISGQFTQIDISLPVRHSIILVPQILALHWPYPTHSILPSIENQRVSKPSSNATTPYIRYTLHSSCFPAIKSNESPNPQVRQQPPTLAIYYTPTGQQLNPTSLQTLKQCNSTAYISAVLESMRIESRYFILRQMRSSDCQLLTCYVFFHCIVL